MITMFTAVGFWKLERQDNGSRIPVVIRGGQVYGVTVSEFLIWSSLIWDFCTYDSLMARYEIKIAQVGRHAETLNFERDLERLKTRGLIATGAGYTQAAALYDLIGNLHLIPAKFSIWERLKRAVIQSRAYRRDEPDKRMLRQRCGKLIGQRELSTAELIRCVDLGVVTIKNGSDLIQQIYPDMENANPLNVMELSIVSDYRDPVVAAVATLFINQNIYFDTVLKGA